MWLLYINIKAKWEIKHGVPQNFLFGSKKTPWSEFVRELYRPSGHCL
jgi:hypothetical protein